MDSESREFTRPGVPVRTDVVEVLIFRRLDGGGIELLQMRRVASAVVSPSTWQPVQGHIETGETALETARREMLEETGLSRDGRLGMWQLEQVHPFFIAASNTIYFSPRFAVEVEQDWEPTLNAEHEACRWVAQAEIERAFVWPGQRAAIAELVREILNPKSPCESLLRLE